MLLRALGWESFFTAVLSIQCDPVSKMLQQYHRTIHHTEEAFPCTVCKLILVFYCHFSPGCKWFGRSDLPRCSLPKLLKLEAKAEEVRKSCAKEREELWQSQLSRRNHEASWGGLRWRWLRQRPVYEFISGIREEAICLLLCFNSFLTEGLAVSASWPVDSGVEMSGG